ncbi:5-oxoprolinase subunit PxpA [Heliobacillus mobilis]|uniref:5-oxoprolinase subunit A n=1 Tax=Heliobacterium mobile TaxID=28064 RepID=A0A6I3SN62_HELMO|nr:5-oxoprolinase subunit PxpA [Heliobacterium mobile]MTV50460.1 5-oxoprolinase subunit PxpA [Heliobacterium mobile]
MRVDLNCDLGESFGAYRIGCDEEMIAIATSVNIACGLHAGDPDVMARTVDRALRAGAAIGAHPGFPDLAGFGRREMQMAPAQVTNLIVYQVGALQAFVRAAGGKLNHVKPHGALYNMAAQMDELAEAIAEGIQKVDPNLILYGLSGSRLVKAGKKVGLRVAQEVFADRSYKADGTLTPRSHPQAVIHDPGVAARRVMQMISSQTVQAVDGSSISLEADTVCIHGDTPSAIEMARILRCRLEEEGIAVEALR